MNCIVPTSETLMGMLGLAGILCGRYSRQFLLILLIQIMMGCVKVTPMRVFGWQAPRLYRGL